MANEPKLPLAELLRSGTQCDDDGVMNVVSRQACHEAATLLEELFEAADAAAFLLAALCVDPESETRKKLLAVRAKARGES